MEIYYVFIILIIIIAIQMIAGITDNKRNVDIFNKNLIKCNYNNFEIKRKRRPQRLSGIGFPTSYIEYSLEHEYSVPWSVLPSEDIIEVYGIKKGKKYLIYRTEWSKNNAIEIKNIVNELNEKIKSNKI